MLGDIDELRLFQQMIANFDAPAFLRRARNVEAAWGILLRRCELQRDEWSQIPKMRLGVLFALAGDAEALRSFLVEPVVAHELAKLHEHWQPKLRMPVVPTSSPREIRQALQHVATSFERFNRRWEKFVSELDLTEINALRDGYNRYYVMEKECAVRSASVARAGFKPLPPATLEDVWWQYPLLPMLTFN